MPILRFATYLAPNLYETYVSIAHYLEAKTSCPTTLSVGESFAAFAEGQVDIGFVCGLPYTRLADSPARPVELLAAPVLRGERYQNRPIYFSDIIVRRDSRRATFDDLRGCAWAYNQRASHSGWNIVCHSLLARSQTFDYFDRLIETGSHQRSIATVLEGRADAAAIDSHVLDVFFIQHRALATELRIIDTLGPSTIPPIVIARTVDQALKRQIQETLLTMHKDPIAARFLWAGAIDHFVQVRDEDYHDIREMRSKTALTVS